MGSKRNATLVNQATTMEDLNPQLRPVAEDLLKKAATLTRGTLLVLFDMGVLILKVFEERAVYGDHAVDHLAMVLGDSTQSLYGMRNLAQSFERGFVEECAQRQMSDGGRISFSHFKLLCSMESDSERMAFLERVFVDSLSVRDLANAIGALHPKRSKGGRKPARPESATTAMQTLLKMTEVMIKKGKVVAAAIFDDVAQMTNEQTDQKLLEQLRETKTKIQGVAANLQALDTQFDDAIARAEQLLATASQVEVAAEAAEEQAEVDEEKSGEANEPSVEEPEDVAQESEEKSSSRRRRKARPAAAV